LNALGFFFSSTELTFPSFSLCKQTNQQAHDNESFMKNTCPNHHHEEKSVEGNQAMPEEDNALADKDKTMCENPSGCDHNYSILVQYNNELGYFKKTYLDKHPLWPKSCSDCGVLFVLKDVQSCERELRGCFSLAKYLLTIERSYRVQSVSESAVTTGYSKTVAPTDFYTEPHLST
jgi:hypothetical protein